MAALWRHRVEPRRGILQVSTPLDLYGCVYIYISLTGQIESAVRPGSQTTEKRLTF